MVNSPSPCGTDPVVAMGAEDLNNSKTLITVTGILWLSPFVVELLCDSYSHLGVKASTHFSDNATGLHHSQALVLKIFDMFYANFRQG